MKYRIPTVIIICVFLAFYLYPFFVTPLSLCRIEREITKNDMYLFRGSFVIKYGDAIGVELYRNMSHKRFWYTEQSKNGAYKAESPCNFDSVYRQSNADSIVSRFQELDVDAVYIFPYREGNILVDTDFSSAGRMILQLSPHLRLEVSDSNKQLIFKQIWSQGRMRVFLPNSDNICS